jgi:hypothetical protein
MTDPRSFYTETIPAHFNATLEAQRQLGEPGRAVYEDMRAVHASIRVDVEGGGSFFLDIQAGRMAPSDAPAHPPFLTLRQDRRAFERIAAEAGDSTLALLGGLSGLAGEMKLTRSRIQNLGAVGGSIRFEVSGDQGFALLTHFGGKLIPEGPQASISVDEDVYCELREGRLDPTQAFMDGKLRVEGDVQLTMQLALAVIAPD